MNSLPPLSLPRFHVNALKQTHKDQTTATPGLTPEDGFDMPHGDPATDLEAEPEHRDDAIEPTAAMPPEIDTGMILNSLETALAGLERTALGHSQTLVSDFLRAAFPTLCDAFLADEITAATKAMAPNEVERLTVKVPAAFEAAFQRAIQGSPKMSEICELQAHADGPIVIDVDWRTGGLQFDMEHFLDSSLARLTEPTHTHEGQNV
ncbi:MAG: hypothetical protein AAF331_04260 [Pseudomonadota bacterium]